MKKFGYMLLCLGVLIGPLGAEELIVAVTAAQLESATAPEGVTVEVSETDGVPVVKVHNTREGAVSVPLVEQPVDGISNAHLEYRVEMASEAPTSMACAEMWAVAGKQAYFSRALNDSLRGTVEFRPVSTPFFLKGDTPMNAARLGVYFEGPGTVQLRNLSLWNLGNARRSTGGNNWIPWAGGIFGSVAGIWGAVVGILASRGKRRRMVLGGTAILAVLSAIALTAGVLMWLLGSPWSTWYPLVLLGGIGGIVFTSGLFVVRNAYAIVERRRMEAMDL